MTRRDILILVALGLLNLVVLGGGALLVLGMNAPAKPAAVQATVISAAVRSPTPPRTATATAIPSPTDIPATPTPTLVPTTAAVATIQAALAKVKAATSYRVQMDMSFKGDLGSMKSAANANGELTLMGMTGEVSGKNSHVTLKGLVAVLLTGDATKPLEMMAVGGKSYVHGPVPLMGAQASRWYVMSSDQEISTSSSVQPDSLLTSFGGNDASLATLKSVGTETFDGKRCTVYGADKDAALSAFMTLASTARISADELAQIQSSLTNAEYKVWVCDDGYLHQIRMSFESQDTAKSKQTVTLKFLMHLYEFNGKFTIAPPTDAVPLEGPGLGNQTATPGAMPTVARTATPVRTPTRTPTRAK